MRVPRAIQNLIDAFERLPGIGPKTAQRLTFYLLHVPQGELDRFGQALQNLRKDIVMCSICYGVDEHDPCAICIDTKRDKSVVCVVEQPLDVLAIDKTGKFHGVYHVLHGKIDPLSNIGPDEIRISELLKRITNFPKGNSFSEAAYELPARNASASVAGGRITEVILATNPTMEGEATAMYIAKQLKSQNSNLKITRIGRGLPTGADLEYADSMTLERAMEGRSNY
jgi:recombination protein RecR